MVVDECIVPIRHDYLMNFGLATVMQHALEKILNTCMRTVPSHLPEPNDDLTAFLDSLGNSTSVSRTPAAPATVPPVPFSSAPPIPCALHTGVFGVGAVPATTAPVFGGVPLVPISTGMATGVSLFSSTRAPPPGFAPQLASVAVPSTSSTPAAASMPKVSGSGISLPVSISLQGHPGGRPDFLTDPIQVGNMDVDNEAETRVDEDLRRMAGDISHKHTPGSKHMHDDDYNEKGEVEDGDGSMFEDLDEIGPVPPRKSGKAKSPAKLGPANWQPADVDIICQNRYVVDWPEMKDYR